MTATPGLKASYLAAAGCGLVLGYPTAFAVTLLRPTHIPARFETDRVYVDLAVGDSNTPLSFYTDTGGGLVLSERAATKTRLDIKSSDDPELLQALGADARVVSAPAFNTGPEVPPDSVFVIMKEVREVPGWPAQGDGILGQAWFAGHTWTWDYGGGALTLQPQGWRPRKLAHALSVKFKTSVRNERESNFPRIALTIDGESVPVLFDTGAETFLTPEASKLIHDGGPRLRATSMIMHSVLERWHSHHSDWLVIDNAQVTTKSRMIRVPSVQVAGFKTGPVWFTEKPDANFVSYMSSMMSGPVEGSAGGNIFHGLKVSLDYPRALMWIEKDP